MGFSLLLNTISYSFQIWDSRSANDPVRRTIHGPHICGDALDMRVMCPNKLS